MEHDRKGLARPPNSASGCGRLPARQWVDPSICPQSGNECDCFPHANSDWPAASDHERALEATFRWVGPAGVERRLSERAELLWKKLAAHGVQGAMPDSGCMRELLRPPFLGQSLLVETTATEPKRIAFVGEALAALTGLRPDCPTGDATPLGSRLLRLAARSARLGNPCRYESDLPSIDVESAESGDRFLTRAIALPFTAPRGRQSGYSIVVVASWRKLLSAEETRALHRELAAAIDWMHRQGP